MIGSDDEELGLSDDEDDDEFSDEGYQAASKDSFVDIRASLDGKVIRRKRARIDKPTEANFSSQELMFYRKCLHEVWFVWGLMVDAFPEMGTLKSKMEQVWDAVVLQVDKEDWFPLCGHLTDRNHPRSMRLMVLVTFSLSTLVKLI